VVHAITIPTPGGPEALTWAEVPDPQPGPGQVLVEVAATAVNRADLMQRQGNYPPPPGAPPYPGLECSGRIVALGPGVTGWAVGTTVCALLAGGGYAEQVAVPAGQLLPVPAGLSMAEAAALPEVACTVWANVMMGAGLHPGQVFLVHGGASGIGTMAIQVASRWGARVFCTAGSERKRERCRELGAAVAIDYRAEDFVARVKEETAGAGADLILDNMGAAYLARNVDALAVNGRLEVIGMQGGRVGELNVGLLMAKRATIHSSSLRARPVPEKAEIVAAVGASLWPAIEAGEIRPVVDRVLPIEQAAEAHRLVEAGEHIGKVVLAVRPD
jgi:putative PIG3 family NAD(P)H quinone oxidoreductase